MQPGWTLSHCIPAPGSWPLPQVGTALPRGTGSPRALRDTPLFRGGSKKEKKKACLSSGCSARGKRFAPELPAPAPAANKIFVLARKGLA